MVLTPASQEPEGSGPCCNQAPLADPGQARWGGGGSTAAAFLCGLILPDRSWGENVCPLGSWRQRVVRMVCFFFLVRCLHQASRPIPLFVCLSTNCQKLQTLVGPGTILPFNSETKCCFAQATSHVHNHFFNFCNAHEHTRFC